MSEVRIVIPPYNPTYVRTDESGDIEISQVREGGEEAYIFIPLEFADALVAAIQAELKG